MTVQVNPVDQWNDPHEVPQDFFLWTWAKDKYYRSKSGTQVEVEQKSHWHAAVSFYFSSKCDESVSSRLQNCAQNAGTFVIIWQKMGVYGLQKGARTVPIVFHLRDTGILHYLFTSQPLCNLFIFRVIMANLPLCLSKHYKVNKNRDIAWNIINIGTK